MIYKNNKKVKKYTLNWSREARKEYVGMLYVNSNSYIDLSKKFSKVNFKYYKDSMERLNKFTNHCFKYLEDNKEIILH